MSNFQRDFGPRIVDELEESIQVKTRVKNEQILILSDIVRLLIESLQEGHKVIIFGNGGSAADCQHIAGELVNRFRQDRRALPALALTTDTSVLTSIANDTGFDEVYSRQIEALGHKGDVAIGISTSGNSPNVLKGIKAAKEKGMITVGFTGQEGGELKDCVDICFQAPSLSTPRIQEVHITVAHVICNLIEQEICQNDPKLQLAF